MFMRSLPDAIRFGHFECARMCFFCTRGREEVEWRVRDFQACVCERRL